VSPCWSVVRSSGDYGIDTWSKVVIDRQAVRRERLRRASPGIFARPTLSFAPRRASSLILRNRRSPMPCSVASLS
jgi:hypothetical protein